MTIESTDASASEERIDSAIADYLDAVASDSAFDEKQFLAQYADVADELQEFMANQRRFAQLAGSLGAERAGTRPPTIGAATLTYFGDYLLEREIARGGMGVIYKARQQTLNRAVAVKLILAGQLASQDTVDRFYAEAKAAAQLTHPNIVAIHEVGQHEEQHYFSMDFVDGQSLSALVREQPLPVAKSVQYVKTVANAIHYAHEQGVLHRDLKPSNILIDESDRPRITDFGLAKQVTDDQGLTATGQILGTPSYMPPEQAVGNQALIGPASDVYSLGAVLYELLTGRPPFLAATPVETILQARQREVFSPRLLNPAVSRDLETICLKCLQKEPYKRYVSAAELADDLQRLQSHEPIRARPVGGAERTARWCRRNPAVAALAVVMLTAFVAVSSQWIRAEYFRFQEYQAKIKAINAETKAEQNAAMADTARRRAIDYAAAAREQADAAEQARHREAHNLYVARMNLAAEAVNEGDLRRAASLLSEYENVTGRSDPRGFDWYYLWRVVHQQGSMTLQHERNAWASAVTPDGRRVVTAGVLGEIRLWDLKSGELLAKLEEQSGTIRAVAIVDNGKRLITGSKDGSACVWDLESIEKQAATCSGEGKSASILQAEPLKTLDLLTNDARAIAASRDGKLVAVGSIEAEIRIIKVDSGEVVGVLTGHAHQIHALAFSPNGKMLASASLDKTIRLWDVTEQELLHTIEKTYGQRAYSLAFSPDGSRLASGSSDEGGSIELWDAATGENIFRRQGHSDYVIDVCFSHDGKRLLSASRDQKIRLWDAETGQPLDQFDGHAGYVRSVRFLPDDSGFISTSDDATAKLWRLDKKDHGNSTVTRLDRGVLSAAWSPDGNTVAVGTYDYRVHLLNGKTGERLRSLPGHAGSVFDVAFSPNGKLLASASRDETIRLWDTTTWDVVATLKSEAGMPQCLAFSPDGRTLASGNWPGALQIWNVETHELIKTYAEVDEHGKPYRVAGIGFFADGATLAVAGRYVRLFSLSTGESRRIAGSITSPTSIAISSEGHVIAGANSHERAVTWTPNNRQLAFAGHANRVVDAVFSHDGLTVVTASRDRTIKIWDRATSQQRATLRGHTDIVQTLSFSPDGLTLVSGSRDGDVRFWRAASNQTVLAWNGLDRPRDQFLYLSETPVESVIQLIEGVGGQVHRDQTQPDASVKQIRLTGSDVNDATLAMLNRFTELEVLSLFNTSATGEGLKYLTECDKLRQLTLMGAAINDEGIAQVKLFPSLTHLQIGMGVQPTLKDTEQSVDRAADPITNAALVQLAGLEQLQYLEIDNTLITNSGLSALRPLESLRSLHFFRTPDVTESGLAELREALPNCELATYDPAQANDPRYGATLRIHCGAESEDAPSCRVGIGRHSNNDYSRKGETRCGPESALSVVQWRFLRHTDGSDVYDIHWTLTNNGETVRAEQTEARFDGDQTVLFSDEHYIALEPRALTKRKPGDDSEK